LRLAAQLRGETAAKAIQLHMVYAPEPPFDAGTPDRAPIEVVTAASAMMGDLISQREKTAIEIAGQMGISAMPGPRYVQSTQTAP
jgi:cyclohexyl-isocyanide hydratase